MGARSNGKSGSVILPICTIVGNCIFEPVANLHTNICLYQLMTGHLKIRSPRKQLGVLALCALPLIITMFLNIVFSNEEVKIDLTRPGAVESLKWSQIITSVAFFFFLSRISFCSIHFQKQTILFFLGSANPEKPNMFILAAICALVVLLCHVLAGPAESGTALFQNSCANLKRLQARRWKRSSK